MIKCRGNLQKWGSTHPGESSNRYSQFMLLNAAKSRVTGIKGHAQSSEPFKIQPIHAAIAKRGKTCAVESRLALVLLFDDRRRDFFSQSLGA